MTLYIIAGTIFVGLLLGYLIYALLYAEEF